MPDHPEPDPQTRLEQLNLELASLGAETSAERNVKRVLPWAVSLAIHAGLIVLGLIVTWAVVKSHEEEEPPVLIVADFDAMHYDPLAMTSSQSPQSSDRLIEDRAAAPTPAQLTGGAAADNSLAGPASPSSLLARSSGGTGSDFGPHAAQGSATFVGITSSNARRIVYVIDASGSMISSFQIIIEELGRSLESLNPQQQFQVVFFQKNDAVIARKMDKLVPATQDEKLATLAWINDRSNILPQGRSNPLAAIEKAMRLKPDVIFLLSENITGSGQFEIDQADLLALLEKLNPIDPETGRRTTQINCVQFLDPDPLDTLRKIAEIHGGAKGYRFLDRRQLGISAP